MTKLREFSFLVLHTSGEETIQTVVSTSKDLAKSALYRWITDIKSLQPLVSKDEEQR
ncbi:hypothetical protein HRE53_30890 (plasmid) [Acaryochloris sp. 'Moss Beach']|uniref:hypothetical protein n=1 Tax=Acaryochloris sp. 'Moss Beach' TaxID=2740837 RepID=UPI001F2B708F|nr:hypothetical protein [Acaryochloris sp. 'Moss Beach']UJB73122.1 hypothetical protein HRE53_30890 [Acaryochloris sp. 'Moss Beach']